MLVRRTLHLRVLLKFKAAFSLFLSSLFLISCVTEEAATSRSRTTAPLAPSLLLVPGQTPAPQSIKSIQLYNRNSVSRIPIIKLNSNEKLSLEFDELTSLSGQFRIHFTHHDKNWQLSQMPDAWIFDGYNELILNGGDKNRLSEPGYFHYEMTLPNNGLRFLVSGNYMVHILDFQSGTELFSLPFYVAEDEGELTTKAEVVFNAGTDGSAIDQLFGEYEYPEFVEFPQFELSYAFVQNRFWGKARKVDQVSNVKTGLSEFHLSRDNSFPANFDFASLDLSRLSTQNSEIISYQPAEIPPKVVLKDDFLNFLSYPNTTNLEYGIPNTGRDAKYAEVFFRFNDQGSLPSGSEIYLIGDFNQWSISDRNMLRYNPSLGVYQTSAVMKEGVYSYKYVTLEYDQINAFKLSDSLTRRAQEYTAFIYYRDPQYQYDRLLQVRVINSR